MEVVVGAFIAPGADGGCGVGVAEGEVLAVGAVLFYYPINMFLSFVNGEGWEGNDILNAPIYTPLPNSTHSWLTSRSRQDGRRYVLCGRSC